MELEMPSYSQVKSVSLPKVISGSALIAGTAIGAGMLAIPLVTAQSGFFPAVATSILVWLFMLSTGLLFMEAALWMPKGSNILTMSSQLLGKKGKYAAGGMFLFLYYCLIVAYFAGGAPLLSGVITDLFGVSMSGWGSYLVFGGIFGIIIAKGAKAIDSVNLSLTVAMIIAYVTLISSGSSEVASNLLARANWPGFYLALPILFGAFGYHNVIPSVCTYLERDRKSIRLSIVCGTTLALVVYLLWQWLIIGSIPQEMIIKTLEAGQPVTQALQAITGNSWIYPLGRFFAFFALTTSLLGVAFSMVDFLSDGLKIKREGLSRIALAMLTFVPPGICAAVNPTIFQKALGLAGGFGEAFLNGLLPVLLVWAGRYRFKLESVGPLPGGRTMLGALMLISLGVIGLEAWLLLS